MTTVLIDLPQESYTFWQEQAASQQTTVEDTLRTILVTLSSDSSSLLLNLETFSDDDLIALVNKPFNAAYDERIRYLLDLGNKGQLDAIQQQELESLSRLSRQYVIARSQAVASLCDRIAATTLPKSLE